MAEKTNRARLLEKPDLNILLIQFRPAGDVLLLTPVVRALKDRFPKSAIAFMVNDKESVLIKNYPLIDRLVKIRKMDKRGVRGYLVYYLYSISVYIAAFRSKYDVVIDFIGNPKSALVSFFSRAPLRIGRRLGIRSLAYNEIIPPYAEKMNGAAKRLSHLRPLGIDAEYIAPELNFCDKDAAFASGYIKSLNLSPDQKIIFIAPNSPRSSRRWKAEYYIETGRALIKRYNAKILIAWGPGEEEYSARIGKSTGGGAEMIPPASLSEMAALISLSDLMITNDSGAKHIANAAGVRTVTIYGPTDPYTWNHPDWKQNPAIRADVPCIQCEKNICTMKSHLCMEKVTPEIVLEAAGKILGGD